MTSNAIRAFRPFTPTFPAEQLNLKIKPHGLVCGERPLIVEIGAGAGLFAIHYARSHPDHILIALERTRTKFAKLRHRQVAHQDLNNLWTVHSDALTWIPAHLNPQSVDKYYLLHPNPYPKAKHANRRWARMPFMAFLLATLKPQGEIELATNEKWYFEEALTYFRDHWGLIVSATRVMRKNDLFPLTEPRSHFEKKYLERGQAVYNLIVRKGP